MFSEILFPLGTLLYSSFLGLATLGLILSRKKTRSAALQPISIIIAARNEAENLPRLLRSLDALNYPKDLYEIIIVSDHSTDHSLEIISSFSEVPNLRLIDFQDSLPGLTGKKAALQTGIDQACYDILAFTDADCEVPSTWLQAINNQFSPNTDYLLSYSLIKRIEGGSSFRLKNFERSIYYALASAGLFFRHPITSSACNHAYRKSAFLDCGGFDGIGEIRSGDDDLLLMKMMPFIRETRFSADPEALVISYDGTNRKAHHHTNIRRASKFRYFPLWLKLLAAFIFIYFISFYYALLFSGATTEYWILLKIAIELLLSLTILNRARQLHLLLLYPVQILLFPLQFVYYATRGTLGKYSWKQ
ncbi:MAG: glycosyltransferase [Candidatus Cloacimonadota bacterium]